MQTATATASPARPYVQTSRTLQHADRRTRQLADAMLRLYGECGEATEPALIREGFSKAELAHHGDAAHALAELTRIRHDDTPQPTDDELVAHALTSVSSLGDRLVTTLRAAMLNDDQIARIWPKFCTTLASRIARLPQPGARQ